MLTKICCFGNTASGKSFLAGRIARELNLPQISLDRIYWQANWTHLSASEFLKAQCEILAKERLVLDGTFSECGLQERFEQAELVILLDSRPLECLRRALARRGSERDRLPDGADDRKIGIGQSLKFLFEILTFNQRDRRHILKISKKFPEKFYLIKSWEEEDMLIEKLKTL